MKKNVIKLNEEQLKKIIAESVKKVVKEDVGSLDNRTKETIGRLQTAFAQVMDLYNEEYEDDQFLYDILSNIEK